MKDFTFSFPTRIVFGRHADECVGELMKQYGRNALIVYGSDRICRSGLLGRITEKLEQAGVSWSTFGGVEENPLLSKVEDGIALAREQKCDVLLAIGGGSVIDTAKAISLGIRYEHNVWKLYEAKDKARQALPIGVVLTMAATASEANGVSVIWNKEINKKRALSEPLTRPAFALLNPELTYTVPAKTTAAGAMDIFAHAFERYLVKEQQGVLRDMLCESIMKTVISELPGVLEQPDSYEHRSQLMWAATMAHSDMIGAEGDFACHALSHIFTEEFGLSHGSALAILMPAWCQYMSTVEPAFVRKFLCNVWGVEQTQGDIEKGITVFREFISACGLASCLRDAGIRNVDSHMLAVRALSSADGYIGGGFKKLYFDDVRQIIEQCI